MWFCLFRTQTNKKRYPRFLCSYFPSVAIPVFVYSVISCLVLYGYSVSYEEVLPKSFWVIQITLFVLVSILLILIFMARYFQSHGALSDVSRSEILDAINALEKVVDGGSKVKLAEIKDFVSYEMKHPAQCDQEKLTTALRKLKTCMVAEVEPNEVLSDVKILFMKA